MRADTQLPELVALIATERDRRELAAACESVAHVNWCGGCLELRRALENSGAACALIRPRDSQGVTPISTIEDIKQRAPRLTIVLVARDRLRERAEIAAFAALNLRDSYVVDATTLGARVGALVTDGLPMQRRIELADRIAASAPMAIRAVVRHGIAEGNRKIDAAELSMAVGIKPGALAARMRRHSSLKTNELCMLGRLLAAGTELESPLASIAAVADRYGFPSESGFCNETRRYCGTTPTGLRTELGSSGVARILLARLRRREDDHARLSESSSQMLLPQGG